MCLKNHVGKQECLTFYEEEEKNHHQLLPSLMILNAYKLCGSSPHYLSYKSKLFANSIRFKPKSIIFNFYKWDDVASNLTVKIQLNSI